MKTALVLAATAALASAQVTQDPATGKFKCDKPNVAYCAGSSLGTDIIIRCDANAVGQPGRCTDNLAGLPPLGVQPALCYQSDPLKGDATCEKNCVVYNASPFTLPASVCTPYYTAPPTTSPTTSYPPTTTKTTSSTSYPPTSPPPTTYGPTSTTTCPPSSTLSYPSTTLTTYTQPPPHGNSTYTTAGPTKPTYSPPPVVTAGAAVNQIGAGALAVVGLVAVFFL